MVDLQAGFMPPRLSGGIVTFRNGRQFYSLSVGKDADGDTEVRIESGEYAGYTRDGKRCALAMVDGRKRWVRLVSASDDEWDIVAFERCSFEEARRRGAPFSFYEAA
jgi:hypothetical protein